MAKKYQRYKQGKYKPMHPHKYEGDVTNIWFRSSWELSLLRWCDKNPAVLKYSSEEIVIPYRCPTDGKMHRYFPDAKIVIKDLDNVITTYLVEVKPLVQTLPPKERSRKTKSYLNEVLTYAKNQAKWQQAELYCNRMGYKFITLTEVDLYGK